MTAVRVVVVGIVAHFDPRDLLYIESFLRRVEQETVDREMCAGSDLIYFTFIHGLSEDERTALAELKETIFLY